MTRSARDWLGAAVAALCTASFLGVSAAALLDAYEAALLFTGPAVTSALTLCLIGTFPANDA